MCKLPTKSFLFGDIKIEAPESQIMVLVPRNFNRLAQNHAGAYCPKYCTIGVVAIFTWAIRAVVVVVAVPEAFSPAFHTDTIRDLRHCTYLLKRQVLEHRLLFMSICWRKIERTIMITLSIESFRMHIVCSFSIALVMTSLSTRGTNVDRIADTTVLEF
jgi:hypothetical protein